MHVRFIILAAYIMCITKSSDGGLQFFKTAHHFHHHAAPTHHLRLHSITMLKLDALTSVAWIVAQYCLDKIFRVRLIASMHF